MPPVLGPRSSSQIVLWSCAAPNGSAEAPSESTKNDASSPVMNSSTTTVRPGIAERAVLEAEGHGAVGLVEGAAHDGALARGEAVGLHHEGRAQLAAVRAGRRRAREDAKGRGGDRRGAPSGPWRRPSSSRSAPPPGSARTRRARPRAAGPRARARAAAPGPPRPDPAARAARARRGRRPRRPSRRRTRRARAMPGIARRRDQGVPDAGSARASTRARARARRRPTRSTFTRRPPRTPRCPRGASARSGPTGCRGRARDSAASGEPPTRSGRACRAPRPG